MCINMIYTDVVYMPLSKKYNSIQIPTAYVSKGPELLTSTLTPIPRHFAVYAVKVLLHSGGERQQVVLVEFGLPMPDPPEPGLVSPGCSSTRASARRCENRVLLAWCGSMVLANRLLRVLAKQDHSFGR